MRERPADVRDSDVAAALARHWEFTVQDLTYLPVGFGGYHWLAVDKAGSRWFVTVSDLAAPWVPDLPAAMRIAAWLATQAGLEFVVAPVPTRAVGPLDGRHALTLFPYLDAGGWRTLCHHARRAGPRQSAAHADRTMPGRLGHDRAGPA